MADIVLKDRNGADVQYPGVDIIKVNTMDGGTADFVDSDTIAKDVELTVDLDDESTNFANGTVEVIPEDGTVFNKVNIPVPSNLIPENIAEGVDIAGIIGTLAAGGNVKMAAGTFTGTGGIATIPHNLGLIPDMIFVDNTAVAGGAPIDGTTYAWSGYGFSSDFWTAMGGGFYRLQTITVTRTDANTSTLKKMTGFGTITETDFTFGLSYAPTVSDATYKWFAIAGLT